MCDSYVDIKKQAEAQNSEVLDICNINIEDVKLWWPVGFGSQHLYNLQVSFEDQSLSKKIGLRKVELV